MSPKECAAYLGNYAGEDTQMIVMRDIFRQWHQAVSGLGWIGFDDDVGKWRLWCMRIPNDPQGDWVWNECMEKKDGHDDSGVGGELVGDDHVDDVVRQPVKEK